MFSIARYLFLFFAMCSLSGCAKIFGDFYDSHPQDEQSFGDKRKPSQNSELISGVGDETENAKEAIKSTHQLKKVKPKDERDSTLITHHYYNAKYDPERGVRPRLYKDYSSIKRDIILELKDDSPKGMDFFEMSTPLNQPGRVDYSESLVKQHYDMANPKTHEFIDAGKTPFPTYKNEAIENYHDFYDLEHHHETQHKLIHDREPFYEEQKWDNLGRT